MYNDKINICGLNEHDIEFLCNKNPNKIDKMIKSLEELHNSDKSYTDYDLLNILTSGRGTEVYRKLSIHRLHSTEYLNSFNYMFNKKKFDLKTPQGMSIHVFRNKNQYGKAPKDLKTMNKFTQLGFFICEGFAPCHNITKENNNEKGRNETLNQTIYLVENNLIHKMNKFSPLANISFRGRPGTSFEGCQFIYSAKTGQLVTDNINRGTWDYGKYGTLAHFLLDVSPWLEIGNGNNNESPEMFYMSEDEKNLYLRFNKQDVIKAAGLDVTPTKTAIQNLMKFLTTIRTKRKELNEKIIKDQQAKEDYIENLEEEQDIALETYVNDCVSKLEKYYTTNWNDYIRLCTQLDSRELIKGLNYFIQSIEINPIDAIMNTVNDTHKYEYMCWLFRSSLIVLNEEDKKPNIQIINDLPMNIKININPMVTNTLNKMNDEIALNRYNKMRDEVIKLLNERLNKINFECRVIDAETTENKFTSFSIGINQFRIMSESEAILCRKSSFQSRIPENIKNPVVKIDNELTEYYKPEYQSTEGIIGGLLIFSNISLAIITGTVLVHFFCEILGKAYNDFMGKTEEKVLKNLMEKADKIAAIINNDYTKLVKINETIKKSKIIKELYQVDKNGDYDFCDKRSVNYRDSLNFIDQKMFNERFLMSIAIIYRENRGNDYKIYEELQKLKYKFAAVEGKPLHNLVKGYKDSSEFKQSELLLNIDNTKSNISRICETYTDLSQGYELLPVFTTEQYPELIKHSFTGYISMNNNINIKDIHEIIRIIKNK